MATRAADLNLLFGIMAVQNDFIPRDALIEAMGVWVLDKSRRLGEILVQRGHLTAERCALLDALVNEHLKLHDNDPEKSLAAAASVSSLRLQLSQIADPDLQASLHVAGSARVTDLGFDGTPCASRGDARPSLPDPAAARQGRARRSLRRRGRGTAPRSGPQGNPARPRPGRRSRGRFLLGGGGHRPARAPRHRARVRAGQYADGRPYYAMRFIRGDNLKEAIRRFHEAEKTGRDPGERSLALRQLLGRFVDVCNAVAYAHSRGVLHRDLKPGNIMLGKYGETLVVDWGLAKTVGRTDATTTAEETTLQPSSGSGVAATQMGTAIGTPPYMSPEQAAGQLDRVGPASDVYSLGATLYTLLTGQPPFREDDAGQLLQKVQRGEFPPPREVKSRCARRPGGDLPEGHGPAAGGPLPHGRALATTSSTGWPTSRSRPGRSRQTVRMQRWARRHRPLVASAAATLLVATVGSLVGFLIVSAAYERSMPRASKSRRPSSGLSRPKALRKTAASRRRRTSRNRRTSARADANFAKAMAAVDDYLTKVSETKLLENPGTQPLRKDLLTSALGFYLEFLEERKDDPNVQAAVASAYLRVAKIHAALGEVWESRKAAAAALRRFEQLVEQRPDDLELRHGLAECYNWSGETEQGDRHLAEALPESTPMRPSSLKDSLTRSNRLAQTRMARGERKRRFNPTKRHWAFKTSIVQIQPDDPEAHASIALTLNNIGVLLARTGNPKEALTMYRERRYTIMTSRLPKCPVLSHYGAVLAIGLVNVANNIVARETRLKKLFDVVSTGLEIRLRLSPGKPVSSRVVAASVRSSLPTGESSTPDGPAAGSK